MVWAAAACVVVSIYSGCEPQGQTFERAAITVGCGRCMFHMPDAQGCPIAAEIEGEHYLIQGRVPEGHQNHAADGICNMTRQALVDGVIRDGKLITSRIELLPAQNVPTTPQFTAQDVHE